MRLNINLASHPYQDLNRFLRRWAPALVVFVIASCALAGWAWHQFSAGRGINKDISTTQQQIHKLDEEKAEATKMLADPNNKEVADTARFLNVLIAKKAFSWTKVFMELEQIMPDRLHVVAMSPELTANNQLQLTLRVAGDSREKAVELVRRIEKSPSFRSAVLRSETMLPPDVAKGGDSVQFDIAAIYVPSVSPSARPVKGKAANESETASDEAAPQKNTDSAAKSKGVKP